MSCQKSVSVLYNLVMCWFMLLASSFLSVLFCAVTSVHYSITYAWHHAKSHLLFGNYVTNSFHSENYSLQTGTKYRTCQTDVISSNWLIKFSWWISCWLWLQELSKLTLDIFKTCVDLYRANNMTESLVHIFEMRQNPALYSEESITATKGFPSSKE
jgi:hypothetical protein